jgi:uncharacterized RDD family membrane protein YckC
MPRRSEPDDEPRLFDLPLEPEPASARAAGGRAQRPERPPAAAPAPPDPLPLFTPGSEGGRPPVPGGAAIGRGTGRAVAAATTPPERPAPVPRRARLVAGLADLLVHAAVGVAAVAGAYLLGARPQLDDWPPFAVLLLTFSFLYSVVPLAFWGQTLGMAWAGLVATAPEGEALTFEQTALRWLGGLLTGATLGLPLLFARRRSPADWLSGSVTRRAPARG